MNANTSENRATKPAILLLGPTGSGKTPLGNLIQQRGLWGAECLHFDFGANLRRIADLDRPDELFSRQDIGFLKQVLRSGALLDDEHFPIAERILRSFLARHDARHRTFVLNGLPRHLGQAEAVHAILDVRAVIHLRCSPESVYERIRSNVGGDRADRQDDNRESIGDKLALYAHRTAPLLDHYRRRGIRIETIDVTARMTPLDVWQTLASREPAPEHPPENVGYPGE